MLNHELQAALKTFKDEHGGGVRLSTLLKEFPAFEPQYFPRGKANDPVAAEKAAKTRAMESLYQALLKAVVTEQLELTDEDGKVDIGAISEGHGGAYIKDAMLPDYIVDLDNSFIKFCQSLPYTVGGKKNPAQVQGQRSPNSQKLYEALKKLEKANGQSAKEFLQVYRDLQVAMKLPKIDD